MSDSSRGEISSDGRAVYAAALLGTLAACGGGGDSAPPPAAMLARDSAVDSPLLLAARAAPQRALSTLRLPEPGALFDWAESAYPQYFPEPRPNVDWAPYVYRYYPTTGNYLGVAGDEVYVLGPVSGGALLKVGTLADFACAVDPGGCHIAPASAAEASRFLQQAQFSASDADIAAVQSLGYSAWLNAQFDLPVSQKAWDWMVQRGYDSFDASLDLHAVTYPINFVLFKQLMSAPDAVRKRIALALSEVFVVSLWGITATLWPSFVAGSYWDMLNANAFGNFRKLLDDVTLSAAMGIYLNTQGNEKENDATGRRPDENYAREVMQLFTIGLHELNLDGTVKLDANNRPIETYGPSDVSNLARVFTGYDFDGFNDTKANSAGMQLSKIDFAGKPMKLNPAKHSTLAASFLGTTVPANTAGATALKTALDTLFNHPNVGPFFGRQMIQRLVTSNPSPAYVARVAAVFNDNGSGVRGDLRAMFAAILLDDEARGTSALSSPTGGKLREPMVRFIQWGRTFGLHSLQNSWKYAISFHPLTNPRQHPFWSPSVFNFFRPGYVPAGTALATAGLASPEFQLVNETNVAAHVNFFRPIVYGDIYTTRPDSPYILKDAPWEPAIDIVTDYSAEIAIAHDALALVQRLNLLLCANQMSAANETLIANALNTVTVGASASTNERRARVGQALLFVLCCVDYLVQK